MRFTSSWHALFIVDNEVLEPPIFKTMEPGEPIHNNKKLRWDNKVSFSLCALPYQGYSTTCCHCQFIHPT